jgi:hypothetical protein
MLNLLMIQTVSDALPLCGERRSRIGGYCKTVRLHHLLFDPLELVAHFALPLRILLADNHAMLDMAHDPCNHGGEN